jgi:hypothetical protein
MGPKQSDIKGKKNSTTPMKKKTMYGGTDTDTALEKANDVIAKHATMIIKNTDMMTKLGNLTSAIDVAAYGRAKVPFETARTAFNTARGAFNTARSEFNTAKRNVSNDEINAITPEDKKREYTTKVAEADALPELPQGLATPAFGAAPPPPPGDSIPPAGKPLFTKKKLPKMLEIPDLERGIYNFYHKDGAVRTDIKTPVPFYPLTIKLGGASGSGDTPYVENKKEHRVHEEKRIGNYLFFPEWILTGDVEGYFQYDDLTNVFDSPLSVKFHTEIKLTAPKFTSKDTLKYWYDDKRDQTKSSNIIGEYLNASVGGDGSNFDEDKIKKELAIPEGLSAREFYFKIRTTQMDDNATDSKSCGTAVSHAGILKLSLRLPSQNFEIDFSPELFDSADYIMHTIRKAVANIVPDMRLVDNLAKKQSELKNAEIEYDKAKKAYDKAKACSDKADEKSANAESEFNEELNGNGAPVSAPDPTTVPATAAPDNDCKPNDNKINAKERPMTDAIKEAAEQKKAENVKFNLMKQKEKLVDRLVTEVKALEAQIRGASIKDVFPNLQVQQGKEFIRKFESTIPPTNYLHDHAAANTKTLHTTGKSRTDEFLRDYWDQIQIQFAEHYKEKIKSLKNEGIRNNIDSELLTDMQAFINGEDTRSGDTKKQQMINEIQDYIIENNICRNNAEYNAYNGVISPELIRKMFHAINKFLVGLLPTNPNAENSDAACVQSNLKDATSTKGIHGLNIDDESGEETAEVKFIDDKKKGGLTFDKTFFGPETPKTDASGNTPPAYEPKYNYNTEPLTRGKTVNGIVDKKGLVHVNVFNTKSFKYEDVVFNKNNEWVSTGLGSSIKNALYGVQAKGKELQGYGSHGYQLRNGLEIVRLDTPSIIPGQPPQKNIYTITPDGYLLKPGDPKKYNPIVDKNIKQSNEDKKINPMKIVKIGNEMGLIKSPLPAGKLKGGKSRKIIFKRNTFKKIDDAPMKKRHTIKKRKNVSKRVIKLA